MLNAGEADSQTLATPPGHASYLVSVLTEDLLAKQSALDLLQRAVLRAEGSSQMRQWRVQEMEKGNAALAADLSQLRKFLHEEKSSNKVPCNASVWRCCLHKSYALAHQA